MFDSYALLCVGTSSDYCSSTTATVQAATTFRIVSSNKLNVALESMAKARKKGIIHQEVKQCS